MKVEFVAFPYFIIEYKDHYKTKEDLIRLIDKSIYIHSDNIYKNDFKLSSDSEYKEFICPILVNEIERHCNLGIENISDCWFQEYKKLNYHPYHNHNCDWVFVYYLNLPMKTPYTTFYIPFTKQTLTPQVKEGDILVFPGWIYHKSSPNLSLEHKLIIAGNLKTKDHELL